MKNSVFLSVVLLTVFSLSGCVGVVHTYEGVKKPAEEVAILKGEVTEFAGRNYRVVFSSYTDISKDEKDFKDVGDAIVGYPREIHMLPGEYFVLTQCLVGNEYAFPAVRASVKAGEVYEVKCGPVPGKLSTVGAKIQLVEQKTH
ncbi:hypothetical protein BIT28_02640 [Photobacterium proteolyticum]|uniref:Lipoprotein n=1 Tax=Photobacterium proteolyticum TaxID=1903952 RepID=A0A1Q9G9Q3_9GAMM|nr:hypothetical protein [Photobacterium proteolyticum]OLQ71088.1 hypothetical protein BIT28_02640 [Photobacterium proteolyticum]